MTGTEELIATALDTTAASFRRRMAIPDLARSSDPRALAALSQLLQDQDRYLRREVVASLAGLRDQRAVEPLLQALDDSDDYIRRDAIEALSKLGDQRALAPLQTLADEAPYAVRDAAQRALGELHRRGIREPEEPGRAESAGAGSGDPRPALEPVPSTEESIPAVPELAASEAEPVLAEPAPVLPGADPDQSPLASPAGQSPRPSPPVPAETVAPVVIAEPVTSQASISAAQLPEPYRGPGSLPAAGPPSAIGPPRAAECFLCAIPPGFNWQQATRLRTFFGQQLAAVQPLYEQMAAAQQRLLELEQQIEATFLECGLHRADKEDDLARCEAALQAARDNQAQINRSLGRARRERSLVQARADSLWHRWLGVLQPQRLEKTQDLLAELEAAEKAIRKKAAAADEEIARLEQDRDRIALPLQKLKSRLEAHQGARQTAVDQIRSLDRQIDEQFQLEFLDASEQQRDEWLDRCGQLARDPEFFRFAGGPLAQALSQWQAAAAELKAAELRQQEQSAAAEQSLQTLAQRLATGFHVSAASRETSLRLSGKLRVSEQHNLFQGFSGADGWASGTGTGEARYELQEVAWTPPAELPSAVQTLTRCWTTAGETAARSSYLQALVEVRRQTAAEYVRFFRTELERDFVEAQP